MTPEQRLADVFVALAGSTTDGASDIPGTLSILAHRSPALLGTSAATVVFVPGGREEPHVAGSDPEVSRLEHDALGWREGPGHDCHHTDSRPTQTALDGHPASQRWPHYTSRAVGLGYTHAAALPLRGHTRASGALVLLSGPESTFSPRILELGQSVADFTAVDPSKRARSRAQPDAHRPVGAGPDQPRDHRAGQGRTRDAEITDHGRRLQPPPQARTFTPTADQRCGPRGGRRAPRSRIGRSHDRVVLRLALLRRQGMHVATGLS